jgi:hypothetical protein
MGAQERVNGGLDRRTHRKDEGRLRCPLCGATFPSGSVLRDHLRAVGIWRHEHPLLRASRP